MKTLKITLVLSALVLIALLSCTDQINSSLNQASESISGDQVLLKEVINSATGSVHIAWFYGEPYYDNCTFNAKLHSDGSFSGNARYFDKVAGTWTQGEVIDLKVDNGNRAKVSCRVRKGNFGEEYTYLFFVVVDNGEGNNSDPDLASWFIILPDIPPSPIPSIAEMIAMNADEFYNVLASVGAVPPTFEYLNGNVQVH